MTRPPPIGSAGSKSPLDFPRRFFISTEFILTIIFILAVVFLRSCGSIASQNSIWMLLGLDASYFLSRAISKHGRNDGYRPSIRSSETYIHVVVCVMCLIIAVKCDVLALTCVGIVISQCLFNLARAYNKKMPAVRSIL